MNECSQLKPMLSIKWTLKDQSNVTVLAILGSIFMDALSVVSQKQFFSLNFGSKTRVTSCFFNSSLSNVRYLTYIKANCQVHISAERFKRLKWVASLFTYWMSSVSIWSTCDKSYFIFFLHCLIYKCFPCISEGLHFFFSQTHCCFSPQPVVKINETGAPTQL